jgi:hypothetical protein
MSPAGNPGRLPGQDHESPAHGTRGKRNLTGKSPVASPLSPPGTDPSARTPGRPPAVARRPDALLALNTIRRAAINGGWSALWLSSARPWRRAACHVRTRNVLDSALTCGTNTTQAAGFIHRASEQSPHRHTGTGQVTARSAAGPSKAGPGGPIPPRAVSRVSGSCQPARCSRCGTGNAEQQPGRGRAADTLGEGVCRAESHRKVPLRDGHIAGGGQQVRRAQRPAGVRRRSTSTGPEAPAAVSPGHSHGLPAREPHEQLVPASHCGTTQAA